MDEQREVDEAEAVMHWYDTVYLPIVEVIREQGILAISPDAPSPICTCG